MDRPDIVRRHNTQFLYVLFGFAVLLVSTLIPPLQSPDELDHLQRAYLLGHGQIILDSQPGKNSGGQVDSGLVEYMINYAQLAGKPAARLTQSIKDAGDAAQWTGQRRYSALPGTASYFPAVYLPQAIGLRIGEVFDFSIDNSYRLARTFAVLGFIGLMVLSFRIYQPVALPLLIIVLPMTVFQIASTTIDGISIGLTFVALSCFMRNVRDKDPSTFIGLVIATALVVSCRAYMLPLFILPFISAYVLKGAKRYGIVSLAVATTLAWLTYTIAHAVDTRSSLGATPGEIIKYYLIHPGAALQVAFNTFTNPDLLILYRQSFIGKLGWLDTPLPTYAYSILQVTLLAGVIALAKWSNLKRQINIALIFIAVAASALIFAAILATWTPHPAVTVQGVQGRYFAIPAILILYALGEGVSFGRWFSTYILGALIMVFSAFTMSAALLDRFYIALPAVQAAPKVQVVEPEERKPSAPLTLEAPIQFQIASDMSKYIKRVGVLFGTYDRQNEGNAKVVFLTNGAQSAPISFALSILKDNTYHMFDVPAGPYNGGRIESAGGVGVSVWQAHTDGAKVDCVMVEYVDGSKSLMAGCPTLK